jgi:ergothioneine biosynthesis protein EgtB
VDEVFAYRAHVDRAMERWLDGLAPDDPLADLVEIGLNHEQQHQELMLTDLKHVFSVNPLRPAYRERAVDAARDPGPVGWLDVEAGVYEVGFAPPEDATSRERFHFDNEGPRHRVFLEPFALADRLVTAGEVLDFLADGGYARPELWLSLGWATREADGWTCPFYWEPDEASPTGFRHFTMAGMRDVDPHEPATHLSYFEADAVARWMDASGRVPGARLPTEFEWEVAARDAWDGTGDAPGSFVDAGRLHPVSSQQGAGSGDSFPAGRSPLPAGLYGEVWQWTQSQYTPYPGYRPVPGALGEYNGKFMANQFVLRGASCFTSRSHARPTYRNFFPPESTWQMTGLRLARSR